jgi:hypothetical protein
MDNSEKINGALKAWNDSQQWPPPATGSGSGGEARAGPARVQPEDKGHRAPRATA